jgi:hypothetical protein
MSRLGVVVEREEGDVMESLGNVGLEGFDLDAVIR